jgi:hemolysin-activating ACP:hemolysin acyltransferase
MKAVIHFEIPPNKELTDEQLQEKLLESIANIMEDWLKGDAVLLIEFLQTFKTDENNKETNYFNWNTDKTPN